MVDCIWNTRVRKHNLKGSEKQTEHDSSGIELNCISVWHFAPLKKKRDERCSFMMIKSISSWHVHQ